MTTEPLPAWFTPPPGGWTADDMDKLPPGAPRMELIDGALILLSPQTRFHSKVMLRLAHALEEAVPRGVDVLQEMTMKLGKHQRPEPDLLVYRYEDEDDEHLDWYRATHVPPEDVLIAVEIVSEESQDRDRTTKPSSTPWPGSRTSGGSSGRNRDPRSMSSSSTGRGTRGTSRPPSPGNVSSSTSRSPSTSTSRP